MKKILNAKHPAVSPAINNLFDKIPKNLKDEYFESIIDGEDFFLERIVSKGQTTPKGTWLCEDTNEWVLLLSGSAKLQFKNDDNIRTLVPGDHLTIPAGTYHRVAWTNQNEKTVWLAIHFKSKVKE
ncbi:MAG: cupin domain-containing protein [Candidatus Cloacimonetes bacterium]|nr:cupin domain-containing protein [Candidatus Cloacimonadota bacterium]